MQASTPRPRLTTSFAPGGAQQSGDALEGERFSVMRYLAAFGEGPMQTLRVQDVIKLLREKLERVGSQSEFARQTGIQRTLINEVLCGKRLPPLQLCRALGLEWVLVKQVAPSGCGTEFDIITSRDFSRILREEIDKAGSIAAWARQFGLDRTHLSAVLHKHRSPDQRIIAALNLCEVLVHASDLGATHRLRRHTRTRRRQPHARWKKNSHFRWAASARPSRPI